MTEFKILERGRKAIEFCGRHPFATGLFAILGVAGLLVSLWGFLLDREEAISTTQQVQRVDEKLDKMIASGSSMPNTPTINYRACDDRQVYLAVMQSARNLPKPYADWEVRGSAAIRTLAPGRCEMTVLFVTGDPSGKMEEVAVQFKTDVPVSSIRIQLARRQSEACEQIILSDAGILTAINGTLGPQEIRCYSLKVPINRTVGLSVTSESTATAASVVGVGDARDKFEFLSTKEVYELRFFQLFRSAQDDNFAMTVTVR